MELTLLNSNFEPIAPLDTFDSFIWTDRYNAYGDVEITLPISAKIVGFLNENCYLTLKDSEHVMRIENLNIHTDVEAGNKVIVKGHSLESILDWRIVWNQTILTGNFQEAILSLLTDNAISMDIGDRQFSRLEFVASEDEAITSLVLNGSQLYGEFVGKAISDLCLAASVGFKMAVTDSGIFQFSLYAGADRSYDQDLNPWVIFSPKFDNMSNSDYVETDEFTRTVALVGGEGEGSERKIAVVEAPGGAGADMLRREMFVDAKSMSRTVTGGTLSDADYQIQLQQKGAEELSKNVFVKTFDGQIDATQTFVYGKDFGMGDIVQVENEYGYQAKSRMTELIHSQDATGYRIYPTFTALT